MPSFHVDSGQSCRAPRVSWSVRPLSATGPRADGLGGRNRMLLSLLPLRLALNPCGFSLDLLNHLNDGLG